jgi:IS4 transposase
VHAVFDLNGANERFSAFELTDESEGECLDRAAVVDGEIRIGDRAYLQADRIANVLEAGGDVIIRAPWSGARWCDRDGNNFDLIATLLKAKRKAVIDQPIWIKSTIRPKTKPPMALRLVAVRKPKAAIKDCITKLDAQARKKGRRLKAETRIAAGWVILVTSLPPGDYPAEAIGHLYRLRWRIEIAFKHLKSGLGLKSPPGEDPDLAKTHILSHLIMALLTEPLVAEHLGDSPRRAVA